MFQGTKSLNFEIKQDSSFNVECLHLMSSDIYSCLYHYVYGLMGYLSVFLILRVIAAATEVQNISRRIAIMISTFLGNV
jgi:hypothetical protein